MEIHYGIACDVCEMNHIKGERFKCLICPDYDLCGNCKVKGYRVLPCNAGHEMERKLAPSEYYYFHQIKQQCKGFASCTMYDCLNSTDIFGQIF